MSTRRLLAAAAAAAVALAGCSGGGTSGQSVQSLVEQTAKDSGATEFTRITVDGRQAWLTFLRDGEFVTATKDSGGKVTVEPETFPRIGPPLSLQAFDLEGLTKRLEDLSTSCDQGRTSAHLEATLTGGIVENLSCGSSWADNRSTTINGNKLAELPGWDAASLDEVIQETRTVLGPTTLDLQFFTPNAVTVNPTYEMWAYSSEQHDPSGESCVVQVTRTAAMRPDGGFLSYGDCESEVWFSDAPIDLAKVSGAAILHSLDDAAHQLGVDGPESFGSFIVYSQDGGLVLQATVADGVKAKIPMIAVPLG